MERSFIRNFLTGRNVNGKCKREDSVAGCAEVSYNAAGCDWTCRPERYGRYAGILPVFVSYAAVLYDFRNDFLSANAKKSVHFSAAGAE